jgi:APA family basic amino acid/polyamine antiporter
MGMQIERSSYEKYAWVFSGFAFLYAMAEGQSWDLSFRYIFGCLTLGLFVFLCRIPQPNKPQYTYKCPWVPLIPCLGILGNFILVSKIEASTWLYFGVYEALGFLFYFTYGLKNSKLNKFHNLSLS